MTKAEPMNPELAAKILEEEEVNRKKRKEKAIANRKDHEEKFTQMVIEALESGSPLGKWDKGHNADSHLGGFPINYSTKTYYRGANVFRLLFASQIEGWSSHWATMTQWRKIFEKYAYNFNKNVPASMHISANSVLPKDEGTPIVFYKPVRGKKKDKATGKLTEQDAWIPMMRFFEVFNISQFRWENDQLGLFKQLWEIDNPPPSDLPEDEREQMCWDIVKNYQERTGVEILLKGTQSYNADAQGKNGVVVVPERKYFESPAIFWAHLFHELVHSTGHKKRLNRPKGSTYNTWTPSDDYDEEFWESLDRDETYAREELVAELGAGMMCLMTGWDYDTRHAQYLDAWLGALKSDTSLIMKMSVAAQKAIDLILGTEYTNKEDIEEEE